MKTISELNKLWQQLGDTPIDKNENIDIPFLQFPRGTFREDIWHWFEDQNPNFIVGKTTSKGINT